MLELINLNKVYVNSNNVKVHALKDINLKFGEKGFTFIVGPSGGGKSTLLNIISGLDGFDSGQMLIKGVDSHQLNEAAFDSYRNTYVGFIFQEYNLLDHLTLAENVSLAVELKNQRPSKEEISQIFEELGIGGLENRYPNEISGGQRQRVAIARVLIKKPAILFADEPAGSVDKESRKYIYDTLKKLSKEILVVAVTHNADVPYIYGDRIINIDDGRVVSDETLSGEVKFADTYGKDEVMVVEAGKELNHFDLEKIKSMVEAKKDKEVYLCVEDKIKTVETIHPKVAESIKKDKAKKEAAAKKALAAKSNTTVEVEEHVSEPFQLVKAKLPAKSAWKLAKTQFGSNKLRTIFTILLTALAISFFAISTILTGFNGSEANIKAFVNGNNPYITMNNNELLTNDVDLNKFKTMSSDAGSAQAALIHNFGNDLHGFSDVDKFIYLTGNEKDTNTTIFGNKLIISNDVKSEWAKASDEIVISDYLAYQIKDSKNLATLGDVIGVKVGTGKEYKVTGIYQTNYNSIKDSNNKDIVEQRKQLISSVYTTVYVDKSFISDELSIIVPQNFEQNISLYIDGLERPINKNSSDITIQYINGGEAIIPKAWKDYVDEDNGITLVVKSDRVRDEKGVVQPIATFKLAGVKVSETNENILYVPANQGFSDLAEALVAPSISAAFGHSYSVKELSAIKSAYKGSSFVSVNSEQIDRFVYRFGVVGNAFLITSIVLGMFAILLLYNFVSQSVRSKRKNIGILRAIGAGMKDVFAIFMIEAALLALFILIGAYTVTIVATIICNAVVQAGALYGLTLFGFNFLTFVYMLAVTVVVSFVGYTIPLLTLSRIKPIEIITRKTGV